MPIVNLLCMLLVYLYLRNFIYFIFISDVFVFKIIFHNESFIFTNFNFNVTTYLKIQELNNIFRYNKKETAFAIS